MGEEYMVVRFTDKSVKIIRFPKDYTEEQYKDYLTRTNNVVSVETRASIKPKIIYKK